MRRYGYPQSFATGVIAAGGTLGAMLPPSTVLAVYGIITQQDIGKLFVAGILPGLLAISMYMATIGVIGAVRPGFLPAGPQQLLARAARRRCATSGRRSCCSSSSIGGLYGGLFTPTEAGGVGAGGAFLLGVARGRLSRAEIRASLLQATRTAAAVFTVLIGALLFGYFLTITQTPQKVTEFMTGLGLGRYGVLALIMLMYLVLGCLMDAMAMIILTVPIIFPVVTALGFDPIWFGVIIVMTVELGLIHPPVGMNVFVIKSVVKDVKIRDHLQGRPAVHHRRHAAPRDPDRVSDHRDLSAEPDVGDAASSRNLSARGADRPLAAPRTSASRGDLLGRDGRGRADADPVRRPRQARRIQGAFAKPSRQAHRNGPGDDEGRGDAPH